MSTSNLQPISGNHVYRALRLPAACICCGGDVNSETGFADLNGEPFKAYVCVACAPQVRAESPTGE